MAQSSALREQPSMDEILASIRRIIDAGETQTSQALESKAEEAPLPEPIVTVPPPAANDAGADKASVPKTVLPNAPRTQRENVGDASRDIAAAVSDYLQQERVNVPAEPVAKASSGSMPPASEASSAPVDEIPEPDISEVEAALRAEFNPVDREVLTAERQAKYGARFTEEDVGAFREVGSLLRGKVGDTPMVEEPAIPEETFMPEEPEETVKQAFAPEEPRNALVSDTVSAQVSHSFSDLSAMMFQKHGRDLDMLAEDMLRPMLQEWLDNNLPSLVERLVRSEIERIARGEPRTA